MSCVPATPLELKVNNSSTTTVYLKCTQEESEMEGVASGKRSALIVQDGKLVRLKGCGNLD
jgi:hypothetical protein